MVNKKREVQHELFNLADIEYAKLQIKRLNKDNFGNFITLTFSFGVIMIHIVGMMSFGFSSLIFFPSLFMLITLCGLIFSDINESDIKIKYLQKKYKL